LPDDIILIHGGGNFGDLWTIPQDYQMDVVRRYPNNKIIFMPQTVYWQDSDNMRECAKLLEKSPNVIICARDQKSYELLVSNFNNKILLVPDMAFYINTKHWRTPKATRDVLLLKRDDAELKQYDLINNLCSQQDVDVLDWPTFNETGGWQRLWFRRTKKYVPQLYDWYAKTVMMPYIINQGIQLIGAYKKIYSTRLHAAILSVLLGKASDLVWFDNSYGKNSNFYDTWLKDCEGIQFIR
jgi:pyruvyl transferase EpsO